MKFNHIFYLFQKPISQLLNEKNLQKHFDLNFSLYFVLRCLTQTTIYDDRFIIISMQKMIWLVALIVLVSAAPAQDKMAKVPGFADDYATDVYSGYLDVGNINRGLHYVFVESAKGKQNNDPVTLWLNGGPGCSSLLGYLQEIGPYFIEDGVNYKVGDKLKPNNYSWHLASNLLFLQSPAGVGYSYNLDTKFKYNDPITAEDSFNAILNFFVNYPEYAKSKFFIAGESYAGKYIPDLAVLIDKYNAKQTVNKINLKGIMVGNGVMTFDTLEQSEIQFVIKKQLVDPEIIPLYEKYCKKDFQSKECQTFLEKYDKDTDGLNPYAIYDYCYYSDSLLQKTPKDKAKNKRSYETQESILAKLVKKHSPKRSYDLLRGSQGAPCAYFDGVFNYFNLHNKEYNAKWANQQWNGPCAENITYQIDQNGSIEAYKYLINRKVNIALYNGNADAVVPFIDTYKGIQILKLMRNTNYEPWFTEDQHSGFVQGFTGLQYVIFKGASHQVPQAKRAESLNFFKNLIVSFRGNEPEESNLRIVEDN